jgi:hypothetical protein
MLKLKILNHWIVPQQGKNHSGFNEAPDFQVHGLNEFGKAVLKRI